MLAVNEQAAQRPPLLPALRPQQLLLRADRRPPLLLLDPLQLRPSPQVPCGCLTSDEQSLLSLDTLWAPLSRIRLYS